MKKIEIGKKVKNFTAESTNNDLFDLKDHLGSYLILFFYPKDFTFVCPTELHAFQEKLSEFENRGCQIVGCSTDTAESHAAYLRMPKNNGGIQGITYPLVADTAKTISTNFDVLTGMYDYDDEGNLISDNELIAYRGLFLIDKEGIVQHQLVNNLPLGRNVDEALRMVDALQHFENHGEVCPANWAKGEDAMNANAGGVADYLASH